MTPDFYLAIRCGSLALALSVASAAQADGGPDAGVVAATPTTEPALSACGLPAQPSAAQYRAALPCINHALAAIREVKALSAHVSAPSQPRYLEKLSLEELDQLVQQTSAEERRIDTLLADLKQPAVDHTRYLTLLAREVDREVACRASAQCQNARAERQKREEAAPVLESLCQLQAQRVAAVDMMTEERSNPSGYMDLARLNELGAYVQQFDRQSVPLASQYKSITGHRFSETMCRVRSSANLQF